MNQTLLQAFYWEMNQGKRAENHPEEADLWKLISNLAPDLAEVGITSLWFPPANKGQAGTYDVGYGTYDLWDLGEFNQKGTVRTKYGTKEELEEAITALHKEEISVYYDAVLNHRLGADKAEVVTLSSGEEAEVWTKFTFPGRKDKYSSFVWDWNCFDGIDWNERTKRAGNYLFAGKTWDGSYDQDYLMGADIDYQNPEVREEVKKWGNWIINEIGFDGFRIDAMEHIDNDFIAEWLTYLQQKSKKELFFVGEAWEYEVESLVTYLDQVGKSELRIFDFPLRTAFLELMSADLDLRWLGGRGLVNKSGYEDRAVTFVDNHDTDRDHEQQYNTTPIIHRKYQAYTYILMREHGLPTIFWKDYYTRGMKDKLDRLIMARRKFAYGAGYETNTNDYNTYSYIREGSDKVTGSGLVMMITQETHGGLITKEINSCQANTTFYDFTGNVAEEVRTDKYGVGNFKVKATEGEGWSVWVPS